MARKKNTRTIEDVRRAAREYQRRLPEERKLIYRLRCYARMLEKYGDKIGVKVVRLDSAGQAGQD